MAATGASPNEIGKPLKLGMLEMVSSSGFKKQFRNRFCILTTNKELDWYKRQEVCSLFQFVFGRVLTLRRTL